MPSASSVRHCFATPPSERLRGIQQDCYRPVVHQFHFHHLLKPSGLAPQALGANTLHKIFVQFACLLWSSGVIERWTLATTDIPIKRKLRDHKQTSDGICNCSVHLP